MFKFFSIQEAWSLQSVDIRT